MDLLTTRGALLQLLRHGPGYGLDLIRRLERQAGIPLAEARVYPVLKSLTSQGLLEAAPLAPGGRRGARKRVYYRLTRSGRVVADRDRCRLLALVSPPPARRWTQRDAAEMAHRLREADALAEAAGELRPAVRQ